MDKPKFVFTGVWVALGVMALWATSLVWLLGQPIQWYNPLTYIMVLVQAHLFTGLFITAHDAMHGVVAPQHPRLNKAIGVTAALLFAYNFYHRLHPAHHRHHDHVATKGQDPDYHAGNPNFFAWYFNFLKNYITIWQVLLMAGTYHLLLLTFERPNLVLFWIIPSILATFQLFYFGTYLPHRGTHAANNTYKARSQSKNHWWAFFSCYFFGYHYEHHSSPWTPWWLLYKEKNRLVKAGTEMK